jgi:hypothetical protein
MDSARTKEYGAVAQLGEHLVCNQRVVGSIPSSSTNLVRVCEVASSMQMWSVFMTLLESAVDL